MAYNIENFLRGVRQHGLNSAKDGTLSGDLTLSGSTTFSGATSGLRRQYTAADSNTTVTAAQSGTVFLENAGSGTTTFTLPAATTEGLEYTFICGDAGGEILIDPQTGEKISIKATADGANVAPAAGTGIKNTAASNVVGDLITLVSDGTDTWVMTAIAGTWASQ